MQVGDQVKLKSGGPVMTVEFQQSSDLSWTCVWWSASKNEFGHRDFPEAALEVSSD